MPEDKNTNHHDISLNCHHFSLSIISLTRILSIPLKDKEIDHDSKHCSIRTIPK